MFVYRSISSQVEDLVGDVAERNMYVDSGSEYLPDVSLPGTVGEGQLHVGETPLCLQGVGLPTGLWEFGEGE